MIHMKGIFGRKDPPAPSAPAGVSPHLRAAIGRMKATQTPPPEDESDLSDLSRGAPGETGAGLAGPEGPDNQTRIAPPDPAETAPEPAEHRFKADLATDGDTPSDDPDSAGNAGPFSAENLSAMAVPLSQTDRAILAQKLMRGVSAGKPAETQAARPGPDVLQLSAAAMVDVPAPVEGRVGRRSGAARLKTRLLGFNSPDEDAADPFAAAADAKAGKPDRFPVGWVVLVQGPGCGAHFAVFNGVSQIGRGEEQTIRLDFGDSSISRVNQAAIAYDDEVNKFYLGHGGKANMVRLNGKPLLTTEELSNGDMIRMGETSLRFVALCGDDFDWKSVTEEDD